MNMGVFIQEAEQEVPAIETRIHFSGKDLGEAKKTAAQLRMLLSAWKQLDHDPLPEIMELSSKWKKAIDDFDSGIRLW